jgi:NAD(P)-dependent dehydrogenase (short-subunit alcohol dehydrogenase family)
LGYDSGVFSGHWALVLGASSGFGEAVSLRLAECGMNIVGVHLDRKATLGNVERITNQINSYGCEALFFNMNAADPEKRAVVIGEIEKRLQVSEAKKVKVLMHSLAFGSLGRFVDGEGQHVLDKSNLEMTLDVMAHSLVYWTKDLVRPGLMSSGGRIFAMTSAGDQKAWPSYGAVSAAKAALEAHVRQLALELARSGITVNAIRAGVTDTPALRKVPEADRMIKLAQEGNPMGRMTLPGDVADAIALLSHPYSHWITGNVISVDGGEIFVD